MKTTKNRLMAWIAIASLMTVSMVGCGDDEASSGSTAETSAATNAATQAPVEESGETTQESESTLELADTIWYIGDITYSFYGDGTMDAFDGVDTYAGTYTWDGKNGTITLGEDTTTIRMEDDGTLYMVGEDGESYAMSLSDAVGDPGQEEMTGDAGSDETVDFSRTAGVWLLDGTDGTARIVMDGEGNFVCYYASGAMEAEGYLTYNDEYGTGDGNGSYYMYTNDGTFVNGFYFDSDIQFHMGNDSGMVYVLEGSELDPYYTDSEEGRGDLIEEEPTTEPMALIRTGGFTGTTPLESNDDFYGGYYYSDLTEDGLTKIINCCVTNTYTGDSMEDYIGACVSLVTASEYRDLTITETQFGSYPAYYLYWLTGENEDTRQWDAILIGTDQYTYMYAFDAPIDHAVEMQDTWYEAFGQLTLEEQ